MLAEKSPVVNSAIKEALKGPLFGLKAYRQFILYKLVNNGTDKPEKKPCSYLTGLTHNPHDPEIWTDATTALTIAEAWGSGWGIGFVFTKDCPFFFLDIDKCLVNGQWTALAITLCTLFAGCAIEVSASGNGLHIFGVGRPPLHGCKNELLGLEFYSSARFVALTGTNAQGDCCKDMAHVLPAFVTQYFPPDASAGGSVEWTAGPVPEWKGPIDDDELIGRAMRPTANSAFSGKAGFADLWMANETALGKSYPDANGRTYDASSADAALAQHLAYRTGKDCERIQRIMLRPDNGLRRDKYERTDYLERTILGAVARQEAVLGDQDALKQYELEQIAAAVSALGTPGSTVDALGTATTPGDSITVGSVDLKGIESALLQQKTQDSVALVFELKQAGKLLFNHSRGQWMEYDGTRWKYETTLKAFDFTRSLARALNFGGGSSSMGSASFCGGVEKFCQASRTFAVEANQFDRDNYLLNTPAGTIDLRTGQMRPHDPDDRITKCTLASPDAVSDGAEFMKFMTEITLGDRELIEFLQVSVGACLSGAIEDHWMEFWTGEGRNGKNTFGDLVELVMGDYARKIASSTLMAKPNESHLAELAQLQGVRLAISSEINDGDHWHESRIKELTGDATINARFMRQDHFTFQRTQKHLIYGNHRPQLRSVDSAIRSRIKIVPFKASFIGREDKDLPRRLRGETGFVLQWLIAGHIKWLEAGKKLPPCDAVEAESADYFASQSTPEMWLAECCEVLTADDRPALHLPGSGDLYRSYAEWKKARGEQSISQTRWAQGVMRSFEKVKTNMGLRYRGLRLLPHMLPFGAPLPVLEVAKSATEVTDPQTIPTRSEVFERFVEEELERLAKL